MSCCKFNGNLTQSACGMSKGGLKGSIYAANLCEISAITISNKTASAITMKTDPLTTNPFYWFELQFKKGTAGFSNELQIGNNTFSNQSVTFSVEGLTATALQTLQELATADVVFIVTDSKNVNHLLGRLEGLKASAGNIGAGTAADDLYGATLTFTGGETELSNLVASGVTIEVWDGTAAVTVTLP